MEKFTKTEIEWLVGLLENVAEMFYSDSKSPECDEKIKAFARLSYEQYSGMAARLKNALADGSKTIKIQ